MYNRNFKKRGFDTPNPKGGFQRAQNKPFVRNGGNRKSRFTGDHIDIRRFINKASISQPIKDETSQKSFDNFALNGKLKYVIAERGFKTPTAIQEKAIGHILEGKDVIGIADTGTGKTGAFLIPMIHKILENPQRKMLTVVPTRELAIQIQEEFVKFTKGLKLRSTVIVGGANIHRQIENLRSGCHVVIGTPGRLKDLIERKKLHLSGFDNVVLDEADRMLDMGFVNDVKLMLSLMKRERQTLLFSATISSTLDNLIRTFLKDPVRISIKNRETSGQVEQDIIRVKANETKIQILEQLLAQDEFKKIIIFTRTKHGAEKLSKMLSGRGFKAESIHGNKSQGQRQRAMKMFKEHYAEILVATDVAARGLDIPDVSHVINFDIPATYQDYVHRIGRTGRAGKTGKALTFV